LYLVFSGSTKALAAMGLTAFVGVAQVLPAMLGGIFWRGATRSGAMAGLTAGAILWLYTLFLPTLSAAEGIQGWIDAGPFGVALLRPEALLGLTGFDPLVHATVWSLGANTILFVLVSMVSRTDPLEQLQATLFIDVFRGAQGEAPSFVRRVATAEELFVLAQRILGGDHARRLFDRIAEEQGVASGLPEPTDAMVARLERELAGSIGAASAHAMITRSAGGEIVSLTDLIDIADETQRLIETSARLEEKTRELEETASELRRANERLRRLDRQKDDFLSQVSHELRTPMTSIRSFSEILLTEPDLTAEERARFTGIIHTESLRLTRLLDEILDISRLESGQSDIPLETLAAGPAVDSALDTVTGLAREKGVKIHRPPPGHGATVTANADRMRQILINLLSNAIKYNVAAEPEISVATRVADGVLEIDIADNGGGVTREEAEDIFSKFTRGRRASEAQGAGLGLPISRAIAQRMGGDLSVVFREDGTSFFRLALALADAAPASGRPVEAAAPAE
ncbi:MAG: ATP-binding protein, partial [Pseudomonadota bacterium]